MNKFVNEVVKRFGVPYRPAGSEHTVIIAGKHKGETGNLWLIGRSQYDRSLRILVKMDDAKENNPRWLWFKEDEVDLTKSLLWVRLNGGMQA